MNKNFLLLFLIATLLFVSCGTENTTGLHTGNDAGSRIASGTAASGVAAVSDSAAAGKTEKQEKKQKKKNSAYEVEIKKYGFALPKLDVFQEELEDLIYWVRATAPTKEEEESNIYSYLKKKKALGKDLKVKLLYVKSAMNDFDELDEEGRPYYHIYICFPELNKKEQYIRLCSYNAWGICDVYEFDAEETYSEKKLQKNIKSMEAVWTGAKR